MQKGKQHHPVLSLLLMVQSILSAAFAYNFQLKRKKEVTLAFANMC